jgi:hypothetical protein
MPRKAFYRQAMRGFEWKSTATRSSIAIALSLGIGLAPVAVVSAAPVTPPEEVVSALGGFNADPATSMAAWTKWAASAPMTFVTNAPAFASRQKCRIDSAQVSRCTDYQEVIGRGGRNMGMKPISEVVTTPSGKQYFRDIPMKKWTANKFGANANPVSNTSRFYSYNPWQPWLTPGITYTTSVDADGTYVIRTEIPNPGDDQPPVTVARVSSTGANAVLQNQTRAGKALSTTTITFQDVPAIQVPPRR